MRLNLLLLSAALLLPSMASAAKPTLPTLNEKDAEKLADGKLVLTKDSDGDDSAVITGLLEIAAEPQDIWDIVLDNAHMVASSGVTKEVVTYKDEIGPDGLRDLRLAFLMKIGFTEIRFHSARTVNVQDGWMRWHLDDDKENDIKATVGSYSLWPASKPDHILFVYKATIETGKRVPRWLENELTESSLKKFLIYVKDVAEGT
jgi:hypothetical protein